MISVRYLICLFGLLACSSRGTLAQQGSTYKYEPEELHQHFKNVSAGYQISTDGVRATLHPQPLIHWQNTVRQQEQGTLRVWMINGRPKALGSIFTYGYGGETFCRHEMISLSTKPLAAQLNGAKIWAPTKAGISWVSFKGTAAPAESPARRLFQMRSLARRFSGTMYDPDRSTERLALIPQPVMRYAAPKEHVVDGAVFSLAVATDPEIFLLIEAVEVKGETSWNYGVVRAHYNRLVLRKDDEIVWEAPEKRDLMMTQAAEKPWMDQPYFTFFEADPLPAPEDLR